MKLMLDRMQQKYTVDEHQYTNDLSIFTLARNEFLFSETWLWESYFYRVTGMT